LDHRSPFLPSKLELTIRKLKTHHVAPLSELKSNEDEFSIPNIIKHTIETQKQSMLLYGYNPKKGWSL